MPTTSPPGPAVHARDLVKTYPSGRGKPPVRALDGLSLTIPAGSVFGLLGPNGAGKSTTVRILSTLSRADAGRAEVDGVDVARDPGRVRRRIGLVPQRPCTDPMATGRENLVLAGRIQALSARAARRRADALLERFALEDAADRLVRTYSGGMARKLDVALGLVHRPSVLFLDEPTTGLDPEARSEMWAEISSLASLEGMTVLLTTHYLDEADRLADRLAIIDHGRVVVEGSPEALKGELHGDTVTVSVADAELAAPAAQRMARLDGLVDVAVDGHTVRARSGHGAAVVPALLSRLERDGVTVLSATVSRPSLDDVYLRHAGRRFLEEAS
jgi:ABC-2 type transport system ATP-binding protein